MFLHDFNPIDIEKINNLSDMALFSCTKKFDYDFYTLITLPRVSFIVIDRDL